MERIFISSPKQILGVHYLAIPCEVDGPSTKAHPKYLGPGEKHYECPRCGKQFVNYRPCAQHMGLISNVMGDCPR